MSKRMSNTEFERLAKALYDEGRPSITKKFSAEARRARKSEVRLIELLDRVVWGHTNAAEDAQEEARDLLAELKGKATLENIRRIRRDIGPGQENSGEVLRKFRETPTEDKP